MFRIVKFEPSKRSYRRLAELNNSVWPEQPTCAEFLQRYDGERLAEGRLHRHVAVAADPPGSWLGYSEYGQLHWAPNPDRRQVVVHVHPRHRRRGIGSALFDHAWSALMDAHPPMVESSTREDRHEAVSFLEARSFVATTRSPISELDLARFDPQRFTSVVRSVRACGITMASLATLLDDDRRFLHRYYELEAEVHQDVPGHTGFVMPSFSTWAESYRDNPDLLLEAHVLAMDCGRPVGLTQLWASQATDSILYTGLTGVVRSHRRRGIATALKVRSLAAVRTRTSGQGTPVVVRTGNEENNPMLGINRDLGFEERPAWIEFVRSCT